MDKGIENILKSHGCGYMIDDYKEMIEEIESFVKERTEQLLIHSVVKPFICDAEEKGGSRCETQCLGCDGFQRMNEVN